MSSGQGDHSYPSGWKIKTLTELATIKRGAGSQYLTYVDDPKDGIRLIRIGDFLEDNPKYVEHTSDIDRFILEEGDILIAGTGATAGITFEVPEQFSGLAFSYNAPRIHPKKIVDKEFLVNFLKSDQIMRQQHSLFTGNAQPFLDTKAIGGFKIGTPPLPEQRKIADILSTWDRAIETTEALLATARAQKRALMQALLTGKRRFPEYEGQEWREVALGEVGMVSSAGVDKKNEPDEREVRLLNFLDVFRREFIHDNELDHWVTAPDAKITQCDVRHGDIFFTPSSETRDEIAISAVAAEDMPGVVYSYHVVRYRLAEDWDLNFRAFVFQTDDFRRQAYRLGDGSGQRYVISQNNFRQMHVRVPERAEQEQIGEILRAAADDITVITHDLDRLRDEKKALMQQLLTGKRRVHLKGE